MKNVILKLSNAYSTELITGPAIKPRPNIDTLRPSQYSFSSGFAIFGIIANAVVHYVVPAMPSINLRTIDKIKILSLLSIRSIRPKQIKVIPIKPRDSPSKFGALNFSSKYFPTIGDQKIDPIE